MKALILKDIYTMSKQMKFYLLIIVVYSCFTSSSMYAFAIAYAAMLPLTALAYDERSKWANLALMMPYTIKDMVISKYVIGYATMLLSGMISIAVWFGAMVVRGTSSNSDFWQIVLLAMSFGCLMLAIVMPLVFRFGVEKGRLLLFVVIGIIIGCIIGYRKLLECQVSITSISKNVMITGIVALVIVGTVVSVKLSEHFYKKQMIN